jgi:phosphate transport system substrate-binding protein
MKTDEVSFLNAGEMKNNLLSAVTAILVFACFTSCEKVNSDLSDLKNITLEEWPMTDCSTSTSPVRDLVAYKLLGVPYKWERAWHSDATYFIQPDFSRTSSSFSHDDYLSKNFCSGTHDAYVNLIEGKTDVIIASRDVSRNEASLAQGLAVELETAPLAIDALVFIVHPKNKVKNLSVEQIQRIYSGEITNWKEVGGVSHPITPYIRNADSGSQEKMETMVMGGLTMVEGLPETIGGAMLSPYWSIEQDEFGIGYTPFFYCTAMVRDLIRVDMLSINGVYPSKKTLREGSYPFISSIYAAIRKDESRESKAYKLFQFLFTKTGMDMIDESGYIP